MRKRKYFALFSALSGFNFIPHKESNSTNSILQKKTNLHVQNLILICPYGVIYMLKEFMICLHEYVYKYKIFYYEIYSILPGYFTTDNRPKKDMHEMSS